MATNESEARGGRRKYDKKARARTEARTRRRIVDSARALLEVGGPAAVNVSAVARGAGVQRLTVYRHFPGGAGIIEACEAVQAEANPPPDPEAWAAIADPAKRLRRALRALYGHYRETSAFLSRTVGATGSEIAGSRAHGEYLDGVLGTLVAGWPGGKRRQRTEVAIRHALRFSTWWSLCHESGLDDKAAARLMVRLARANAGKTG